MKKFKEFLENYDVYLDMPKKKKAKVKDTHMEISTNEERAEEKTANQVVGAG